MGSFKLGKMTLRSLVSKPETIMYPAETRFQPEGLKGRVDNDMSACILCSICEKRCPTGAISVQKQEKTWSIDYFRCVQCGTCVRECPKHSLVMLPQYAPPASSKSSYSLHAPELQDDEKEALAAKEAAKAAKIKAALEAKAAREAAKKNASAETGASQQ